MPLTDSTARAGAREQVQAAARRTHCPQRDKPWVLVVAILGSSLAFIEGSVVNLALPAIQSGFSTTFSGVQWVLNAYLLVLGAFMLVGGSLGDRHGLRRIFVLGTAIFGAGAAACAFAPTLAWLVAARLVQGFGGALLVPASLALIGSHFDDEERGRAIGTWAGASALTTAIGPVLGGWLVDQWGWQAVFLMVAPLAAATVAMTLWRVPATRPLRDERPDYAGALLLAGSLVFLILALVDTGPAWRRIAFALAALLAGAAFVRREHRYRHPMLPLALFRSRSFSGANLMTLLLYFALTGVLFFLPFNLIQVQGWSTTAAGAALLPFTVIMGFGSTFAGDLIRKLDSRRILTIGPMVTAAGFFALAFPGTDSSYAAGFLPGIIFIGIGMTLSVAPLTTVVMNSVSDRQAGLASGVNNTAARLAGVFAIAVLTAVAVASFSGNVEERLRAEGIPDALTGQLVDRAAALAELSAPEGSSPQITARVDAAVDQAYVRTFRWLVLLCGMLAVGSGLIAWRCLPADRPKDDPEGGTSPAS